MDSNHFHTEKQLFSLIATGDEAAFEQLFHLYVLQLRPIILQIVRSETVVKDIIQEVFLYLWLGREKLVEIKEPRYWIFKITYNRSYQYVKRQLIRGEVMAAMKSMQESALLNTLTDHDVLLAETTRLVQQAIRKLPSQSRKIYELHRDLGMKPADIAQKLGLSIQSVRNSLTRSGKTLREHLAEHGIIIPLFLLVLV